METKQVLGHIKRRETLKVYVSLNFFFYQTA